MVDGSFKIYDFERIIYDGSKSKILKEQNEKKAVFFLDKTNKLYIFMKNIKFIL